MNALNSAQHAVSELLYSAILLAWAQMMACDTECRAVNRNIAEAVLSNCDLFIVENLCPVFRKEIEGATSL